MAVGVQVVFDASDPAALAEFWAAATGYVVQPPPEGFDSWEAFLAQIGVPEDQWDKASACIDPEGKGPRFFFQKVTEPKTAKNPSTSTSTRARGTSAPSGPLLRGPTPSASPSSVRR
jgi:Glyoxalase-like domain